MSKLFAVMLCVIILASCGKADISEYGDRKILVSGLTDSDFYITANELASMKCESATAVGKSEKAGTITAYGPTLKTFLETYGVELSQLKSVRFAAGDGYSVTLGQITWDRYEIYMSIANGSSPLESGQQPLRIVIPGGDSGNWIRMVTEIQFSYAV